MGLTQKEQDYLHDLALRDYEDCDLRVRSRFARAADHRGSSPPVGVWCEIYPKSQITDLCERLESAFSYQAITDIIRAVNPALGKIYKDRQKELYELTDSEAELQKAYFPGYFIALLLRYRPADGQSYVRYATEMEDGPLEFTVEGTHYTADHVLFVTRSLTSSPAPSSLSCEQEMREHRFFITEQGDGSYDVWAGDEKTPRRVGNYPKRTVVRDRVVEMLQYFDLSAPTVHLHPQST